MPKVNPKDYNWYTLEQKKPKPYYLLLLKDVNGNLQTGWWGGNQWNFGVRRIGPIVMWRKYDSKGSEAYE